MFKKTGALILAFALALTSVSTPVMAASGSSKFTNGGTIALNEDIQAVPSTPTNLTSTDTWVFQLVVSNTTAGALTLTISDRASSPLAIFTTVSIAANSVQIYNFQEGIKFKSGLTWSASNTGLTAAIKAKRI